MGEPYPQSGRRIVTADEIAAAGDARPFVVPEGALLTPLARDLLRRRGDLAETGSRRSRTLAPLVVANWKSNKTRAETRAFVQAFAGAQRDRGRARVVVCPPFTALAELATAIEAGARFELGAQDVSPFDEGAHTGEVAARHLAELGVGFAIVGHSERRGELGETDEMVRRKTRAALAGGIAPIVCVGETRDERAAGRTQAIVRAQVRAFADGLDPARAGELVLAYEPRWAIGAGVTPSEGEIAAATFDVRAELERAIGNRAARVAVLYGGSVTAENAAAIARLDSVTGFLVGGASLDAKKLAAIAAVYEG